MVNNYSCGLDYISHSAHYSKNWDKNKQQEYNKWYYENKTKKKNKVTNDNAKIPDTPYDIKDVELFNQKHKKEINKIPKNSTSSSWNTVPEIDENAKQSDIGKLIDLYGDYLVHHGITGMKWGEKNGPPYPLDDNISTGNSLKTTTSNKNTVGIKGYLRSRQLKKKRQASLEKARQTRVANIQKKQTAEEHAAEVKKILESGDRNRIKSIASEVSYNELNTALQKADLMAKLNTQTATWAKVDAIKDKLDKSLGYYTTSAKTWNLIAQLYNNTQTDKNKQVPYLPTNLSPNINK